MLLPPPIGISSPPSRTTVRRRYGMAAPGEGVHDYISLGHLCCRLGDFLQTRHLSPEQQPLCLAQMGSCRSSSSIPLGLAAADYIGDLDMGFGRLDTYKAVSGCRVLP
jgi:hypothetical protein